MTQEPDSLRRGPVTEAEISGLLTACLRDMTIRGRRDAAIISLLCGTGIDPDSLCGLLREDCRENVLAVRHPTGVRHVFLSEAAGSALAQYLQVLENETGPLLRPIAKNGNVESRPLSPSAIGYVLRRRGTQAGIRRISAMDVLYTQRLVSCGQWDIQCCCAVAPGRDLLPLAAVPPECAVGLRFPASSMNRRRDPIESSRTAVLGYLGRLDRSRRQRTRVSLDALARALGATDALHVDWTHISCEQLSGAAETLRPKGLVAFSHIKRSLSGLLSELARRSLISEEVREGLAAWYRDSPPRPTLARDLSQVETILGYCSRLRSPSAARDGAVIAMVLLAARIKGGPRDLIDLMYSDLERLSAGWGMREAPEIVQAALGRWFAIRGAEPGPLLTLVTPRGQVRMERMSPSTIATAIRKRSIEAGCPVLSLAAIRKATFDATASARV